MKRSELMRCGGILAVTILGCLAAAGTLVADDHSTDMSEAEAKVHRVLEQVPLVDGHNDVPWSYKERVSNHLDQIDLASDTTTLDPPMHTDIARLRQGGVGAQFWSVYIPASLDGPGAARTVFEQIDLVHRMADRYPETFEMAYSVDDIERIFKAGKIASLIGMEGGHSIENSLGVLRQTYRAGARYMTITHGLTTDWADSATDDPRHNGLSEFGKEVLREMNRIGMLVDLSHVSPKTMHDALDTVTAPVIFSHSSARALTDHPRNVPDDVLKRMDDNGGVVMVTFVPGFVSNEVFDYWGARAAEWERLDTRYVGQPDRIEKAKEQWREANPAPQATLEQVADHIDHLVEVAGIDHVGIGSDYDGIGSTPVGLEDVSTYPALFVELLGRGYTEDDLAKIAGRNVLRAFRHAEDEAAHLQAERAASDALIEELDGASDDSESE